MIKQGSPVRGVLFTTRQARGAWPNGTRIAKTNSVPVDTHSDGARGTIIGSVGPITVQMIRAAGPDVMNVPDPPRVGEYGYFIEWDDTPGVPVFTRGSRLRKDESSTP